MSNPPFNNQFTFEYDRYSLNLNDLPSSKNCFIYQPDNVDDYHCLAIWQPAPELGAKKWTLGGKRILIGIYKDEGRKEQIKPYQITQWTRSGTTLTIYDNRKHYLNIGDKVNLQNVNIPSLNNVVVINIPTNTQFQVQTSDLGTISGIESGYSPVLPINVFDTNVVFRLLPSYRIVEVSTILEILQGAEDNLKQISLRNVNTKILEIKNLYIDHHKQILRNSQELNELKKPLARNYSANGKVILPDQRFNKYTNSGKNIDSRIIHQFSSSLDLNERLYIYDYYGFDLNDNSRGPFFSNDIVKFSNNSENNLVRKLNNSSLIYDGILHNRFGDFVIGATNSNLLITRKPIIPILYDQFNVPYKKPI